MALVRRFIVEEKGKAPTEEPEVPPLKRGRGRPHKSTMTSTGVSQGRECAPLGIRIGSSTRGRNSSRESGRGIRRAEAEGEVASGGKTPPSSSEFSAAAGDHDDATVPWHLEDVVAMVGCSHELGEGTMAGLLSVKAVALAAVLAAAYASCAAAEQPGAADLDASAVSYSSAWLPARATWYGAPNGAGPDDNGGACGFKHVNQYPFSSMTSCGNQPLFKDGKGCGSCYQIRCSGDKSCSGKIETVMITDMNYYPVAQYHFDLSGTAFGALAKPGLNEKLRHSGIIDIQFRRVPCNFPGLKINFHVVDGSNAVYLAVLIEYEDMDGDVIQVDMKEANSGSWTPMRESWGSIWRMDSNHRLQGPFSMRITSDSGKKLVANNVIPANWRPNTDYRSFVQFS
ncbi:hypothetical protein VPH35_002666 [Triticum aestivum]|uniref:expansin-B6 isoform X1 n=1 Tax=Triticum aestivum TaxID=4565 RepID=UPI001D03035E|nr:expansin-B6-like isoform X1 [Triticum aestivum]